MNLDYKIANIYSDSIFGLDDNDIRDAAALARKFLDNPESELDDEEYERLRHVWEAYIEPNYNRSDEEVVKYFDKLADGGSDSQLIKSIVREADNSKDYLSIIEFIDEYGY